MKMTRVDRAALVLALAACVGLGVWKDWDLRAGAGVTQPVAVAEQADDAVEWVKLGTEVGEVRRPLFWTVQGLHARLGREMAAGRGRLPVAIDKRTFEHPLEGDGGVVLDVRGSRVEAVLQLDGDGGIKELEDGTESSRRMFILTGE